jgi:hypothetical protein
VLAIEKPRRQSVRRPGRGRKGEKERSGDSIFARSSISFVMLGLMVFQVVHSNPVKATKIH